MVGYGYDLGTCKHVCKTIDCKTWIFCSLELAIVFVNL